MQTTLAIIVVVAAAFGLIIANLPRKQAPSRWAALRAVGSYRLVGAIALLIILFTALTAPSAPPFAPGMRLGWGFLAGGILGLYALLESARSAKGDGWVWQCVGLLAAAALGPGVLLLIFASYPNDALIGCALGAAMVAVIGSVIIRSQPAAGDEERMRPYGLEIFAVATAAIAAGARLGIEHGFPHAGKAATAGGYWVLPALLAVGSALAFSVSGRNWPAAQRRWFILISGLGAALVAVIITAALKIKLLPGLDWRLPFLGMVVLAFLLAVLYQEENAARGKDVRPVAITFAGVLLVTALAAVCFKFLAGYGEALAVLGAVPIVMAAYLGQEDDGRRISEGLGMGALTLLLMLTLYRVFLETTGRGWVLDYQQQYNLIALLLGAAATFGVMAYITQNRTRAQALLAAGRRPFSLLLARTLLLGAVLTLAPLAAAALWGVHGVGAFLAGLIIGEVVWLLLVAWTAGSERSRSLDAAPHVMLLAAMLVAVQLSPWVIALNLSRELLQGIAGAIILAGILWVALETFAHARLTAGTVHVTEEQL